MLSKMPAQKWALRAYPLVSSVSSGSTVSVRPVHIPPLFVDLLNDQSTPDLFPAYNAAIERNARQVGCAFADV